jgi:glycosyltransferase involved in cell wall biosynthesis
VIIAFDTWVFTSGHRNSGIYNYAKNILQVFRTFAASGDLSMRLFFTQGYSDDKVDFASSPGTETVDTRLLQFHRLWQLGGITAMAARAGANLIFSPTTHTFPFGPIPVITTIHDVTPLLSPSFGRVTNLLEKVRVRNAAKFSVKCITDSQCSKRDLVDAYGIPPEKITVAYLGYDRQIFNASRADTDRQKTLLARYGIQGPYIFHHGALQPRKNLSRLIHACRILWQKHKDSDFQLVLAGPLGWKYEHILEAASEAGAAGRVVLTGPLPDEDLAALLKGAMLCVIPSLYEGFCLPMVEAMACGVPTIASNSSCLPEVSGGVLRYFEPRETEDIATKIEEALSDTDLRQELARRGLKRASEFSWLRCAKESLGALRELRG